MTKNESHIRYLNYAKHVSMLSDYTQHHIGCVLVYKRQVLSVGYNTNRTHPIQAEYNKFRELSGHIVIPKAHAETICLSKADRLNIPFDDSILYIFRAHKNGIWAMARPCAACIPMILDRGIKRICYSTENGWALEYLV